jgi:hypothetical protein
MKNSNQIFCINSMINANSIEMIDNSKFIVWLLNLKKKGFPIRQLNKITYQLTK